MRRLLHLPVRASLPVCALVAAVLASSGCGGSGDAATAVLRVSESDFAIKAPKTLASGDYRLEVGNRGPNTHELLLVRSNGRGLPLRTDGITVDEDAVESQTVTIVEGFPRGDSRDAHVHLTPGRYVLLCNMSGHYLSGMHRTLIVR